mgnify:CR=1 FL=1
MADQAATRSRRDNAADQTSADITALRDDLASLREDVGKLFSHAGDYAGARSREGLERGREVADEARRHLDEGRGAAEDTIRRHPFAAVGVALGAGLLIATLSRR